MAKSTPITGKVEAALEGKLVGIYRSLPQEMRDALLGEAMRLDMKADEGRVVVRSGGAELFGQGLRWGDPSRPIFPVKDKALQTLIAGATLAASKLAEEGRCDV